jgi:hypothetical protein
MSSYMVVIIARGVNSTLKASSNLLNSVDLIVISLEPVITNSFIEIPQINFLATSFGYDNLVFLSSSQVTRGNMLFWFL